jgi:hypothetical protein
VRAAAFALVLALIAGGAVARPVCSAGLHAVTTAQLYFGRDEAGAAVSEADWAAFMDAEVTPRFPEGLTVWDAHGQWRRSDGRMVREETKVMLIVLSGSAGERGRLAGLIGAYKDRFHQRSVLITEHGECASFEGLEK